MATPKKVHELCAAWPDLEGAEFTALVESVKATDGLVNPVRTYKGEIIDGKNRLRACEQLGIVPRFLEWIPPDDKKPIEPQLVEFVLANNDRRRHLNASQRALIAARMVTTASAGRPSEIIGAVAPISQADAAETMHVSRDSVKRATKVVSDAAPEVVETVRAGKATVRDAAKVADLPKPVQRKAAEKVKAGKAKTLSAAAKQDKRDEKPPKPGQAIIAHDSKIDGLIERIMKSLDDRAHLCGGQGAHHMACEQSLKEFASQWKAWKKAGAAK